MKQDYIKIRNELIVMYKSVIKNKPQLKTLNDIFSLNALLPDEFKVNFLELERYN